MQEAWALPTHVEWYAVSIRFHEKLLLWFRLRSESYGSFTPASRDGSCILGFVRSYGIRDVDPFFFLYRSMWHSSRLFFCQSFFPRARIYEQNTSIILSQNSNIFFHVLCWNLCLFVFSVYGLDYYHTSSRFYDEWIQRHFEILAHSRVEYPSIGSGVPDSDHGNSYDSDIDSEEGSVWVATGAWAWGRFWTQLLHTAATSSACLRSCRRTHRREPPNRRIKHVIMTTWGVCRSLYLFPALKVKLETPR